MSNFESEYWTWLPSPEICAYFILWQKNSQFSCSNKYNYAAINKALIMICALKKYFFIYLDFDIRMGKKKNLLAMKQLKAYTETERQQLRYFVVPHSNSHKRPNKSGNSQDSHDIFSFSLPTTAKWFLLKDLFNQKPIFTLILFS